MNLILGSKSPRRQELLKGLGFNFLVRTSETDESYSKDLNVTEVAAYIASKKSEDLRKTLTEYELLLCADTVVSIDNLILGKPNSRSEAFQMLELLSGRSHEVMTAICLTSLEKQVLFTVTTKVYFNPISKETISHYVDLYKPFDKAGAYGIQEWIGFVAVNRIEGSYTNVVGLPTCETHRAITEFQ
jgi:septum formation protein